MIKKQYGLFKDTNDRTIYINRFYNKAFIITNNDSKIFNTYSNRYFIPVLVYICLDLLKLPSIMSYLLTGLSLILIVLFFHLSFLKNLSSTTNYTIKEGLNKTDRLIKEVEPSKLIVKAIIFILIGILLPINAMRSNYNNGLVIISYLGAFLVFYYGYKHIIAYKIINKK